MLSQTLYIHTNLLPVSSFLVFSAWTDHSVVLEDSHTLMELFYFTPRSASHATKAREEERALRTVSATYFWLLFPLDGFGFIQGLFSLGIIEIYMLAHRSNYSQKAHVFQFLYLQIIPGDCYFKAFLTGNSRNCCLNPVCRWTLMSSWCSSRILLRYWMINCFK